MLLAVDNFLVRECRQCFRIPVHHAQAAIDEAFAVEIDKHLDDALRAHFVHRESRAVPVAGCSQSAQLLENDASMFVSPVPGMAQELLSGEVVLLNAILSQPFYHFGFSGNRGMVCARHPASILALHAGSAHKNVLDGVVKHVAHVENSRHIRRRNDYCVWLTRVGLRAEKFVIQPILIPF